jgi:spore maturation protein CgeB
VRELDARGHDVLFLERNVFWYAENRDLPDPLCGDRASIHEVFERYRRVQIVKRAKRHGGRQH